MKTNPPNPQIPLIPQQAIDGETWGEDMATTLRDAEEYSLAFRLARDRLLAFATWRSEEFDPEATRVLRSMLDTGVVSKDGLLRLWDLWESYHTSRGTTPPSLLE